MRPGVLCLLFNAKQRPAQLQNSFSAARPVANRRGYIADVAG